MNDGSERLHQLNLAINELNQDVRIIIGQLNDLCTKLEVAPVLMGRAVAAQVEMTAMITMNQERAGQGLALAYDEAAFRELLDRYALNQLEVPT